MSYKIVTLNTFVGVGDGIEFKDMVEISLKDFFKPGTHSYNTIIDLTSKKPILARSKGNGEMYEYLGPWSKHTPGWRPIKVTDAEKIVKRVKFNDDFKDMLK